MEQTDENIDEEVPENLIGNELDEEEVVAETVSNAAGP